jgi:hypothetical protein
MDGKVWLEIAQIVGLSQATIAKHLGINRVVPHYWAHGMRPVPKRFQQPLKDLVKEAMQNIADWPLILPEEMETGRKVIEQVKTRLSELLMRITREYAHEGLLVFHTLTPADMDHIENAALLVTYGTAIADYGKALEEWSPLLNISREKATEINNPHDRLEKEGEPDAALSREPSEPEGDGQPGAVSQ